ncbi:unnamed protein product, partial [Iphiclides podalirius]
MVGGGRCGVGRGAKCRKRAFWEQRLGPISSLQAKGRSKPGSGVIAEVGTDERIVDVPLHSLTNDGPVLLGATDLHCGGVMDGAQAMGSARCPPRGGVYALTAVNRAPAAPI